VGDSIAFTDGAGSLYAGVIREIGRSEVRIDINEKIFREKDAVHLTLAIAPTKSLDRMEWCLEKLTELGVLTIIPMRCARSERKNWNEARAAKILISAMKQSQRTWLPRCLPLTPFQEVLQMMQHDALKYIALKSDQSVKAAGHYQRGSDVFVLIGPEGDFTETETELAREAGCIALSLGEYRLRTETAAVVAAATFNILNQV
jgi:16S rRNA (uracil1498-N3)-methyltransferase